MRRVISLFIIFLSMTSNIFAQQTKPSNPTQKPKTDAQKVKEDRVRALIPGLGGAPPKKSVDNPPTSLPTANQGPLAPASVTQSNSGNGLPPLNVRPANPLIFGVDVQWGDNGSNSNWDKDSGARARRLSQLLKGAGVRATRISIKWSDVESKRGTYDWKALDRLVSYINALGTTVVATVSSTPDWAVSAEQINVLKLKNQLSAYVACAPAPEFHSDLTKFANALGWHYKGKIQNYEFWNQPDGIGLADFVKDASGKLVDVRYTGNVTEYAQMLTLFSQGLKKSDPTAAIAVGGLQKHDTEFVVGLFNAKVDKYFDSVALHPVKDNSGIAFDWIDKVSAVLYKHGPTEKSIWITEYGWQTQAFGNNGINPLHQARLIRESLTGIRERTNITLAIYKSLNDYKTNESDSRTTISSGLCGLNLMPKASYYAFRESVFGVPENSALKYNLVMLTGGMPTVSEAGVRGSSIKVSVDAGPAGITVGKLWRTFSQGSVANNTLLLKNYSARLKSIGANFVRIDPFPSTDMVRREGVVIDSEGRADLIIDWTYADGMVDAITKGEAKPVFSFGMMQTRLASAEGGRQMPRDLKEWAGLVRQTVRRYNLDQKRGIKYWELGNEPDRASMSLPEWITLYQTFVEAVTAEDPTAKVGGPGISEFNDNWLRTILSKCSKDNVRLDFITWHAHGVPGGEIQRQAASLKQFITTLPFQTAPELIISELTSGAFTTPANDHLGGATQLLTAYESLLDSGISKAFVHELKEGKDFRNPSKIFNGKSGLLTWDDQPKPSWNTLELLSGLEGVRIGTGSEDTDIHALATRSSSGVHLILWRDAARSEDILTGLVEDVPVRLQIKSIPWKGASYAKLWSVPESINDKPVEMDIPIPFQAVGKDIEIPIVLKPGAVVRLELSPATAGGISASLETPRYIAYGGASIPITATVTNTSTTPKSFSMTLLSRNPDLQLGGKQKSGKVVLAGKETKVFAYSLKAPLLGSEGVQWVQFKAGDVDASLSVKIAAPVSARVSPPRADVYRSGAPPDSLASTSKIRVITENKSDERMTVGIISGRSAETVILPPKQSGEVIMSIVAPFNTPGNYITPVAIRLGEKELTRVPVSIGVPAACNFVATPPKIDGTLSEWTKATAMSFHAPTDSAGKSIFPDLTGQIMTMWDDKNLYIAAVVTGPGSSLILVPAEMWRSDSLQIAVDTRRNANMDAVGYRDWDYVIGLAKARIGSTIYRFHGGKNPPGLISNGKAVINRLGNRLIYEASIPWSELEMKPPTLGSIVGFAALANNNDGQGRRYLEWADGMSKAQKPGQFIGLRFVKD